MEEANKKSSSETDDDGLVNNGRGKGDAQAEQQISNKKRRWAGFDKETELFLRARGGVKAEMGYDELCGLLSERYADVAKAGMVKKRKVETLNDYVLANIPTKFLNGEDDVVRVVS